MISKSLFAVVFCLLITIPSMADLCQDQGHGDGYDGGYANYSRLSGYYYGDGGEFTLYGDGLNLSNAAYNSNEDMQTSGLGGHSESFQTFCLEIDEYAGSANIWVSTEFKNGDPGSHAFKGGRNTNSGDNLSSKTAYLYYNFAIGTLSNYDYDGSGRSASAGSLQKAIWYIEEELDNWNSLDSQAKAWVIEARNAIDTGAWTGLGDVRVLQMYNYNQTRCECNIDYRQDFLYVESVPVPAAALLGVFGMAIAGIKLRKFA